MAGRGQRFKDAGVDTPKPFIDVRGKPMVQVSIENLGLDAHYILVMQEEHFQKYGESMRGWLPRQHTILRVDGITQGPASTCLLAEAYINNSEPLLYANCDQYMVWKPEEFINAVKDFDGGLLMYRDKSTCGSFALMDESCYVKKTVEKEVVSDVSSTGIYYWSKGSDFVRNAREMIAAGHTAKNGEYYAINVYNEGIAEGKKYVVHFIKKFWRLGVPAELETYLKET